MLRSVAILIVLAAMPLLLSAQRSMFRTYTVQDGLVTNLVRQIFQDSKGFIWIATWEGLCKYNGHKFINYTTADGLPHNVVNNFMEADGKLFITFNDGSVGCIQNGSFQTIAKYPEIFSHFVKLPNGKIIIDTYGSGIYEYQNGRFYKPKQDSTTLGIKFLLPLNDSLLLGGNPYGKLFVLTTGYKLISTFILPGITIESLYKDSQHRIWLCSNKGLKLLTLDIFKRNLQLSSLPQNFNRAFFKNSDIYSIIEDSNGGFWVSSTKGLARLSKDGYFDLYTQRGGMTHSYVSTFFCDRENNVWMGTREGLIKMVSQNNMQVIQTPGFDEMNTVITIMPYENKDLLLTTFRGAYLYKRNSNSFSDLRNSAKRPPLFLIPRSSPLLFFNTTDINYFDSIQSRIIPLKTDNHVIYDYSSCVDDAGNAFFGLHNGIASVSGKKVRINYSLPYRITALTMDREGFMWAGTWEKGLYRIQYTFKQDSLYFLSEDFSHLIPHKLIRSLFTDSKGNIWVGTRYKGAYCLVNKGNNEYNVMSFEQEKGLSSNFIRAFAETSEGDIWLGSDLGLDKLIKEKNGFRVFNFSKVSNYYATVYSIAPAANNEWWCIANNKLVKFKDQNLERTPPLKARIISARFGSIQDSIVAGETDSIISLTHAQNLASFEFTAPNYINEKQILFSYRLSGTRDTSWSVPQNVHEVTYASLQSGSYTFEVRTMGWNGQPGESTSFRFRIKPPFWKTWWFMSICIFGLGSLLFALYRYRISQILKLQKVRNRIATDLHDDIGTTLTNISILSQLSDKSLQGQQEAKEYLQRISEEVNESARALNDIIWNVNSNNDTLEEMLIRMRRFAAELFDHTDIRCHLALQPAAFRKKLNMEQRRDLYLVYKESLNNIYKHAEANTVWVELSMVKNSVKMLIKDDGKGFMTEQDTHRNGLKNLRARVEKWKGSISIVSQKGNGTDIEIIIPTAD